MTPKQIQYAVQLMLDALNMPVTETNYIDRMKKKKAAMKAGENVILSLEIAE